MEENGELKKAKKIEQQVERWDLFAKIAPTIFLIGCFAFLAMGFSFEVLFNIGMIAFGVTAVVWWFWTIYSIRFLVKLMHRTTQKLLDTGAELMAVKKEYKEIHDEKNHRD